MAKRLSNYEYFEEYKKKGTLPGKIVKYSMYFLILLIYVVVMVRIFISCDPKGINNFIQTEAYIRYDGENPPNPLLFYPDRWTNEKGTVQIEGIFYIAEVSELQLTLKFNTKKMSAPFSYELRIFPSGDIFSEAKILRIDSNSVYTYRRLLFENVTFDEKTDGLQFVIISENGGEEVIKLLRVPKAEEEEAENP